MLDKNLLLDIQERTDAEYMFEIPGREPMLRWAANNFRGAVAVAKNDTGLRKLLENLGNVLIFGQIGKNIDFSMLHLHGKTLAIIHGASEITVYQTVMIYLRQILLDSHIVAVVIEDAERLQKIMEGLLDESRFLLEWHGSALVIMVHGVYMETEIDFA